MRNYTLAIVAGMRLFVPCVLQAAETDSATEDYASLFNGKDLRGWVTVGTPDSFAVEDNAIRTTGAHSYPSWLRTEKEYENFVLRFS